MQAERPSHVRTLPWPEVVAFYEDWVAGHGASFEPMLAFVRFLASSRYASALFPCPEGELLRIGRVPGFAPGNSEIQARFVPGAQQFQFAYFEQPDDTHPWSRECEASEWQPVFLRLLHKRLQWFHEG